MATTPTWTPVIAIAIVAIIAGAGLGGFLYYRSLPGSTATPLVVQLGDNVTVNYIGVMGTGAEAGKVFDTSIYSVATNSIGYPKTLEFGLRGSAANYTPLAVHVSGNTPQNGYTLGNLSFIQVVTGFWQGLIGLPGNQSRAIVVPPSLGYGSIRSSCLSTQPLSYTLPVVETLTLTQFGARFSGVTASIGAEFADPYFGWPVLILNTNSSFTTIENLAQVGMVAHPTGWPVLVTSVESTTNGTGAITLLNELSPAQAGLVLGHAVGGQGLCSSPNGEFIVSSVNTANGTYTENYNTEVTGETLIFTVTVVDIYP